MRFHARDIVAVQKPIELLPIDRHNGLRGRSGPMEAFLFQTLLPKTESVTLPVEHLHRRRPPVPKGKQLRREGIELELSLDQHRQGVQPLTEVHRLTTEIYHRQIGSRPHHDNAPAACSTLPSAASSTPRSTTTPFGSCTRQLESRRESDTTSTRWNKDPGGG